jgi:hypothetical protein
MSRSFALSLTRCCCQRLCVHATTNPPTTHRADTPTQPCFAPPQRAYKRTFPVHFVRPPLLPVRSGESPLCCPIFHRRGPPWSACLTAVPFLCTGRGAPPRAIGASSPTLEHHCIVLHRHHHPLLGEPLLRWILWSRCCCSTLLTLSSLCRINQDLLRPSRCRPVPQLYHHVGEPSPQRQPSSPV